MDTNYIQQRRLFTGRACAIHPAEITAHAIDMALQRAEQALKEGRLITPTEAMVAALGADRNKDTLFSLARTVAWETGGDQNDILCRLGEKYPEFS